MAYIFIFMNRYAYSEFGGVKSLEMSYYRHTIISLAMPKTKDVFIMLKMIC